MARTTKRRVTARHSTESEVEESLLASARPSALRDVVLPEPGDEPAPPAAVGPAVDPGEPETGRARGARWAVGAVVALGAAVAIAWAVTGREPAAPSGGGQRAAGGHAAPPSAAAPTAAAEPGAVVPPRGDADDGVALAAEGRDGASESDRAADVATPPTATDEAEAAADAARRPRTAARRPAAPSTGGEATRQSKPARSRGARDRREAKGADRGEATAAGAAAAAAGPADLDALLDRAAGGGDKPARREARGEAQPAAAAKPAKDKLSRADVQKGMRAVKAKVDACFQRYGVAGTVVLKVVIDNTGQVAKVEPTGKFKGTETGTCVADAVAGARFPAFSGRPMSLTYPFLLQ
ncbi:MAG: hypothetical protein D6689_20140 [Deltaproteobacteria bacterium]|nr:MAG: hypothetical protein D6689_20140 [Deltaproteobacteria bacterium]